jgi:transcription antitermination factor NusG
VNGDEQHWYAARVKYRTEKKLKTFFLREEVNIQHFIPFRTVGRVRAGQWRKEEEPVIPCLIFVRADYTTALSLPDQSGFTINYLRNFETGKFREIPDKQMQDFMMVLNLEEKGSIIIDHELKRGDKVRVIRGVFAGIEGELVRVQGHKRVVIRLEGVCSLATTYIPPDFLEKIK